MLSASAVFVLLIIGLGVSPHLGSRRPAFGSRLRARPADATRVRPAAVMAVEPVTPPRAIRRSGIFPRAVLHGPARSAHETGESPLALEAARPSERHAPPFGLDRHGVYATSAVTALRPEQRGQRAAERVLSDALAGPARRGRNAALDVIVVGASREGVAAMLRLLRAGLRVLLVDAGSAEGPRAARLARDRSLSATLRALGRERLPIVWGHRVLGVAARSDGMLELSAERAAWYTANVIVAIPDDPSREREHAA